MYTNTHICNRSRGNVGVSNQGGAEFIMSQIFIETIARAISDYRFMLRRHLNQAERRKKLAELNLKDPTIFDSPIKLFEVATQIVKDIELSVELPQSYYAYSGMAEFAKYLKEYLSKYEIENGRLVHCAQKASKAMIEAIQLTALPEQRLTVKVADSLNHCSDIVVQYGSEEQVDMYEGTLEQKLITHRDFYTPIYDYFQSLINADSAGDPPIIDVIEEAVG